MQLPRTCLILATCAFALLGQAAPPGPAPSAQDVNAWRRRAFAAENRERFAEAADNFIALSRAEPERTEWLVAAGRCLGRSGRFKEAVQLLDDGRKRFPSVIELPSMLARTLLLQAESGGTLNPEILWADAAEIATGVLAIDPNDEDSRLVLAQASYLLGDWQAAVREAEEAVRRHPKRAGAHVLIGRIATDRFRDLLRQNDRDLAAQAAADLAASIDRERQLARRSFRRAAELEPTRAHPHIALAQLALIDNNNDDARAHVLDALAVDPDVKVDHDLLGRDLDWQGRRDMYRKLAERYAATTTTQGDKLAEKLASLRFHEGRANFDGGAWQAARDCFDAAIKGDARATNSHYYLFLCDYQLKEFDAAERHAAAFAAFGAPAFADVLRGLGGERRGEVGAIVQFLAHRAYQGKRLAHSRDLNHVIACVEDSAAAWNNHAFLCRETGRFDDALASYQHAIEKEPDSPQLWNDAAVILQHHLPNAENLTKARGMYEKAIELADQVLRDGRSSEAARSQANEARRNAKANLAELPR